ncbi:MAG: hypothetical protein HYV60_05830, partial [Planctomycetia bacterium]|nr:hypothetical protein [Planctomycetia bacterium]
QLDAYDAQHRDWQSRWETLLDQFEFPRDWDVHLASKILGGLVEARNEWDKSVDLDKRIGDMTSGIAAFTTGVQALCGHLAPTLVDFVSEVAMQELQSQLDAAKVAHRDNDRLQTSCSKLRKRQAAKKEQIAKFDVELSELLSAAGTKSEAEFEQVALAAKRRAELTLVSREATSQINAIRRTEDEGRFSLELQDADADSIDAEQHRLAGEVKRVETDFDAAFKKSTLLNEQREKLDGASHAADVALVLESTRSQLATAVDRWAPLVLAQALMKHSIKKFEREHQPAMLAEVERLLRRMTLGRYTGIERKLDEHGTLLVVDEAGKRKEPHQLSTGTRLPRHRAAAHRHGRRLGQLRRRTREADFTSVRRGRRRCADHFLNVPSAHDGTRLRCLARLPIARSARRQSGRGNNRGVPCLEAAFHSGGRLADDGSGTL